MSEAHKCPERRGVLALRSRASARRCSFAFLRSAWAFSRARLFEGQATYTPDIWVSSHAGQFNLHKVYKPGDPDNPSRFGDLAAYKAKITDLKAAYEKQLAEERAAAK